MSDDITIPPAALEAAARKIAAVKMKLSNDGKHLPDDLWKQCLLEARAACLAMLKAWPGMKLNPSWELRTHKRSVEMILPVSEPPKMDRKAAVAERLFGDD